MTAPLFSSEALQSLRALNVGSLTSRARIDRPAYAAGQGGANTGGRTWVTIDDGDAVPCRVSPLVPSAGNTEADENTNVAKWLVVFDLGDPAIHDGDRLTVTGTDVAGGAWSRSVIVVGPHYPRTFTSMRAFACNDAGPGQTAAPTP